MTRVSAGLGHEAGFSLQEVLVVAARGLIIPAAGLPIMTNAIANMKLRASRTSVSGLLRNARSIGVQQFPLALRVESNAGFGMAHPGTDENLTDEIRENSR